MITIHAFGYAVQTTPTQPVPDPGYTARLIRLDAERAAKLGDDPTKSCSYPACSDERDLWMRVYWESVRG